MKLYQALYNPMIYESDASTISLHKTKEGARKSIESSKAIIKDKWEEMYGENGHYPPDESKGASMSWEDYVHFHWWGIDEIEVLE